MSHQNEIKLSLEFTGNTAEDAKKSFKTFLGSDNVWFSDLLYAIKEEWIDQGGQVTDILIRKNMPAYVATVKAYLPFVRQGIKTVPTDNDLDALVQKFTKKINSQLPGRTADFSFYVEGLGIFRCNYSEDSIGKGMSIRYLTFTLPTFQDIHYPEFYSSFIKALVSKSPVKTPTGVQMASSVNAGGLILHVGATGSGKTTSIAAEIGYLAEHTTGAIITYENPIEYRYIATKAPVRQFEVGKDITKNEGEEVFENLKRHLLRNNPSVVLVGEARDNYEIKSMLDFAARGHLVFGTIHASNVSEALTTLMAVSREEPFLLANSLKAIVAHKLVTGADGKIIPLLEIMIPEVTVRTNIATQQVDKIISQFYKEKTLLNGAQTFENSLDSAVASDKLTREEAREIKKANLGIFIQKKEG